MRARPQYLDYDGTHSLAAGIEMPSLDSLSDAVSEGLTGGLVELPGGGAVQVGSYQYSLLVFITVIQYCRSLLLFIIVSVITYPK